MTVFAYEKLLISSAAVRQIVLFISKYGVCPIGFRQIIPETVPICAKICASVQCGRIG